jgi:short-subunit dehydrogenase
MKRSTSMNLDDLSGCVALVTGASSGIGAAFARELAARGCALVLVARREDRLRALAAELHLAHGTTAHVVPTDLSTPDAAGSVRAAVERLGLEVDVLVNDAGFSAYGPFSDADAALDRDIIMVGAVAAVGLTHAVLPGMVARGRGVVVNVSSAGAFQPLAYQSVYAASKAFLQSFSEALWAENQGTGVRIVACCPAAVDTEYFSVLGDHEEAAFGDPIPPTTVVDATFRALAGGRMHVVIGLRWKAAVVSLRMMTRQRAVRVFERAGRPRDTRATGGVHAATTS